MKQTKKTPLVAGAIVAALAVVGGGYYLIQNRASKTTAVIVPALSARAQKGKVAFDRYCIGCHGNNGAGTDKGPPLVNDIYKPSHHSDVSFVRAVTLGSRQHHWLFGNMPPVPNVGRDQIDLIVTYIRELQRANGIG